MKKKYHLIIVLFSLVLVSSCKKDEETTPTFTIIGKWNATDASGKLTTTDSKTGKPTDQDLTQKLTGVVYEFKADKTFTGTSSILAGASTTTPAIAGTYTLTGNDLKTNYKKDGKDLIEYYTVALTSSTLVLSINKDLYIKGLTESKDPNASLIAALVIAIDLKVNCKKL